MLRKATAQIADSILEVLKESETPQTRKDLIIKVYQKIGQNINFQALQSLLNEGKIKRIGKGVYEIA